MLMPKPKKRANYAMVDEDDPQFARFWDAYPKRVSKKDARKAWAKLAPSQQTVTAMVDALAWQVAHRRWDSDKYDFAPYPASWLNDERWKDERPPQVRRVMSDAASLVFETLGVKL